MTNTTSTTTITTTVTTLTTTETTKMTNTQIAISCLASDTDDELVCTFGDPRVKQDGSIWTLEVEDDESIVFVLQNSVDSDTQYALKATSSQDEAAWLAWEMGMHGVQSQPFPAASNIEIEITAVVPGQPRAKKSVSSGSIKGHGRADPTLEA